MKCKADRLGMSAQIVFGIQDLREIIMSERTKIQLVLRKKIEKERIKICRHIYRVWRVVPKRAEPGTAKALPVLTWLGEHRWTIKHNNTLLVYPVTHGWWHHRFIWGPPGFHLREK